MYISSILCHKGTKKYQEKSLGTVKVSGLIVKNQITFFLATEGTFRFVENVTSFKNERTFRFADYKLARKRYKKSG